MSADLSPSLLLRLRAGDSGAGEALDAAYREVIVRFCLGYLGDEAAAEDAAQEVFVRVLEAKSVPDHFRAWLYRIARNHCLNLLRARGARRDGSTFGTENPAPMSQAGHLTKLVAAEEGERVARALEELSLEHREVLRLRYGEDLSREAKENILGHNARRFYGLD